MKIHHIALWTSNLERLKNFYVKYFECKAGSKYTNLAESFQSYFLDFGEDAKLEIMKSGSIIENDTDSEIQRVGLSHFAISVGSPEQVKEVTKKLKEHGYTVASPPRTTGDGFFESCILDPDGNRVEITV